MFDLPVTLPRRSPSGGRVRAVLLPILGLAILIGAWWLSVGVFKLNALVLPTPGQVLTSFAEKPRDFLVQIMPTLEEMLYGYGLAVVAGLVIALVISQSRILNQMFYPLLVGFNAVPKQALGPMAVTWFGLGQSSKVMLVLIICFFPVVVSSYAGFTSTPSDFVELSKALSASRLQTFFRVRFPAALPQTFVGLKVAAGLAGIGAVVGELSGAIRGLGSAIYSYNGQGQTADEFVAIILLSVISIALYFTIVLVERLVVPWAAASRTAG
jgi:NitT/TauT family transport system permease protein